MSEDSLLVERVRQGEKAAFAALVENYQTPVYNLAYRMLGNAGEAEDATQEAFLRAYARLGSYNNTKPFKSWLFAIASHHCSDKCDCPILWVEYSKNPSFWKRIPGNQADMGK